MAVGVPVPLSKVGFSTREELLTSDLNRLEKLVSRDAQDVLADEGRTDESRDPVFVDPQSGQGTRIDAATLLATLGPLSGFGMTLTYGQAFLQDAAIATDVTAGGDDSQYQAVRWPSQTVTPTTPDASNPRIDLVVATPAVQDTDSASRNVLVNPTTRALAALNVFKTNNPLAAVTVVAGTPAAQPTAPAVPAGGLALFEIYVPAGAADSTAFTVSRRLWRRGAVSVGAGMHGVLRDCTPTWGAVDETVNASLSVGSSSAPSRAVIDGQVVVFSALSSLGPTALPGVVQDAGANNPFAAAAAATVDKVYYLYLCGGRNAPQGRRTTLSGNALQPTVLVESLVAPGKDGRPSANITTPRGVTRAGALYVGVGYVVMNTTLRKGCYVDGDWVHPLTGQMTTGPATFVGFNDGGDRSGSLSGSARTAQNVNTKPALADAALLSAVIVTTGTNAVALGLGDVDLGATDVMDEGYLYAPSGTGTHVVKVDFRSRCSGAGILATPANIADISGFLLWSRGWNMHVPRYAV